MTHTNLTDAQVKGDGSNKDPLKIGLFGYGCVGQGLYHLIEKLQHAGAEVVRIGIKDNSKNRDINASHFTLRKEEVLSDPSIQLIVELIDDADEAYQIVREALILGRKVVSANKKMLAEHLLELLSLQHDFGGVLLYEAAVCGSIPIIRTVEAYYAHEPLNRVNGIFNGSSNYILSKVFDENLSYGLALQQAQELGFAERDPSLDVGGFDARYKLTILAAHGFGLITDPEEVVSLGIDALEESDLSFARENGLELRLVASAERIGDELALFVLPHLLPKGHLLRGVENEFNAVVLEGAFSGPQFYRGKGAGSDPTASAVWADIVAARRGYAYEYSKLQTPELKGITNELYLPIYARAKSLTVLKALNWERLDEQSSNSLKGVISLQTLVNQQRELREQGVFIAAFGAPLIKNRVTGMLEEHQASIGVPVTSSINLPKT